MKTKQVRWDDNLNPEQLLAVQAPLGKPVVVLAGPGSGKTRVLAHRLAWLIQDREVDPSKIAAVTFGTRAAEEIQRRAMSVEPSVRTDRVCTIHALCRRILAERGDLRTNVRTWMVERVLQDKLTDLNWDVGWRIVLWWINRAKMSGVGSTYDELHTWYLREFERMQAMQVPDVKAQMQAICHTSLNKMLKDNKAFMFPDLINDVYHLTTQKSTLKELRSKIRHALVDEGQDTPPLAVKILSAIVPDNLFVVGDPNQTLYRFSGADPQYNLYAQIAAGGSTFHLVNNYRSQPYIVEAAKKLCTVYEPAFEMEAVRKNAKSNPKIVYQACHTPEDEAAWALSIIRKQAPKDVYVGARTNAQLVYLEMALSRTEIPYIVLGESGFFNRRHVSTVLSYARLAHNHKDNIAFANVYNIGTIDMRDRDGNYSGHRFLGAKFLEMVSADAGMSNYEMLCKLKKQKALGKHTDGGVDLARFIENLSQITDPLKLIDRIIFDCYLPYYKKTKGLSAADPSEDDNITDDLNELIAIAGKAESVEEFLSVVKKVQRASSTFDVADESVVLTTIHKLKACERPVVIGLGWTETLLPHRRAITPDIDDFKQNELTVPSLTSIDDERCAAYVLITRAQDELYLSSVQTWGDQEELQPSRFLFELGLLSAEEIFSFSQETL